MTQALNMTTARSCATCSGEEPVATDFEAPDSRQKFHGLDLDGAVCVCVGVHDCEPLYRGVWMWNSRREAGLALAHVSPRLRLCLEAALLAEQECTERSSFHVPRADRTSRTDPPPHLAPIDRQMTALRGMREQAAWNLAICGRLASPGSPDLPHSRGSGAWSRAASKVESPRQAGGLVGSGCLSAEAGSRSSSRPSRRVSSADPGG